MVRAARQIRNQSGLTGAGSLRAKPRAAPSLGSRIIPDEDWEEIARELRLSRRHLQIARATFDRWKESAIASALHISEHTVRSHVKRLYRMLGVTDRVDLVLLIFQVLRALPTSSRPVLSPLTTDIVAPVACRTVRE